MEESRRKLCRGDNVVDLNFETVANQTEGLSGLEFSQLVLEGLVLNEEVQMSVCSCHLTRA